MLNLSGLINNYYSLQIRIVLHGTVVSGLPTTYNLSLCVLFLCVDMNRFEKLYIIYYIYLQYFQKSFLNAL